MKTAIEIRDANSFELIRTPEELAHWFGRHAGTKFSWQGQRATKAQREAFLKLWTTMTSFEFKPVKFEDSKTLVEVFTEETNQPQ